MREILSQLENWNLRDPQVLATTPTSTVYAVRRGDERLVLKRLTPLGARDEGGGAMALAHFAGRGAVRLMACDAEAHLLEWADGADLVPLVRDGRDDEATRVIGETLNALHAAPAEIPRGLVSLYDRFASLRNHVARFPDAARLAEELLASPRDVRVLHGDIHHQNIIHHSIRGWLAIDPKGLVGERTYDAANALLNPVGMPELVADPARLRRQAGILAATMNLDPARLLAFTTAHAALSRCWSIEDG